MTQRFPLVLNGSQIQELQPGDSFPAELGVVPATPSTIPARNNNADLFARIFQGVASSAQYADLAEKYISDATYDEGTVVVFGGNEEVTVTNLYADTRVAGVISEYPGYIMNSLSEGQPVALRGKVPVKVIGAVKKGDLLVTSELEGTAKVATGEYHPSAVFAKSLENREETGPGTVIAVIL
jgi:hypothetical protein